MPRLSKRKPQDVPPRDALWHAFVFKMRTWITEPGKPPVRPQTLMILNLTDDRIMLLEAAPDITPDWIRQQIERAITRPGMGVPPHRPRALTFADPTLVEALSPALSELEIECKQMDTPDGVDKIIADMERHLRQGRPEIAGLLSVKGVTPEFVGDLFAAAVEFHRAAPWVRLVNVQGLAVQFPVNAAPRFISVMGNAGIEYGLSVSLTWDDFVQLCSGTDDMMHSLPQGGLRSLLFNDVTTVPFDDLDALEKYRWPIVSPDMIPVPIIFDPRREAALRPERDELLWYQAALRAIPILVRDHLHPDGRGDYAPIETTIRVPTSDGEADVLIRYPAGVRDLTQEPAAQREWYDESKADEPPIFDRRRMEGPMAAALAKEVGEHSLFSSQARRAQKLMYKAWESDNAGRRISLAHQALAISPDCTDAYVLLAEEEADTLGRALELYQQGVAAGERALQDHWQPLVGHFWGSLETRPYMRAKQGLAETLWRLDRRDEARAQYEDMLRLNPSDNQGIRYLLVDLLLGQDDDASLSKLLGQYREPTAYWLYTQALIEFRRNGTSDKANKLLDKALRQNRHVPPYLTGQTRMPNWRPDHIGMGDENEAIAYVADHLNHWRRTTGAVEWLKERLAAKAKPATKSAKPAQPKEPTFDEVFDAVMAEADGPITVEDVVRKTLERKTSKSKNPAKAVETHLRSPYGRRPFVFIDHDTLLPMHVAMQGVRFRVKLDREMASSGNVPLYPYFVPFLRDVYTFAPPAITPTFENDQGVEIPVALTRSDITSAAQDMFSLSLDKRTSALDLKPWLSSLGARRGDSLLLTVLDWNVGRFQLAYEPERRQKQSEITQQNRALADLLYELLEETYDEHLETWRGLQRAYTRLPSAQDYPGDHWTSVIEQDGRMRWEGFLIVHADAEHFSLLDEDDSESEAVEEKPFTPEQGQQVYRFRARYGKKELVIEMQGTNTLGNWDAALRAAFKRDPYDHLSEFTLITPRGKGKQPRRKPFGPLDPLGNYAAHGVRIAGLGLEVGARIEYIYDFGDNLEHDLTLEAIEAPEAQAKYPRYLPVKR